MAKTNDRKGHCSSMDDNMGCFIVGNILLPIAFLCYGIWGWWGLGVFFGVLVLLVAVYRHYDRKDKRRAAELIRLHEERMFRAHMEELRRKPIGSLLYSEIRELIDVKFPEDKDEDFCINAIRAGNSDAKKVLVEIADKRNHRASLLRDFDFIVSHCDKVNAVARNARCFYYKGIALNGLGKIENAVDSFLVAIGDDVRVGQPEFDLEDRMRRMIDKELPAMKKEVARLRIERDGNYSLVKTGVDYEKFVVGMLKRAGYRCEFTPANDQGVDIVVSVGDSRIAIQCKFYKDKVSNSAVQEVVAGKAVYDCKHGCVVSNAPFTKSAMDLAKANSVELLRHEDLVGYIQTLGKFTTVFMVFVNLVNG